MGTRLRKYRRNCDKCNILGKKWKQFICVLMDATICMSIMKEQKRTPAHRAILFYLKNDVLHMLLQGETFGIFGHWNNWEKKDKWHGSMCKRYMEHKTHIFIK